MTGRSYHLHGDTRLQKESDRLVRIVQSAGGCPRCSTFVWGTRPVEVVSPLVRLNRQGDTLSMQQIWEGRWSTAVDDPHLHFVADRRASLKWKCGHTMQFPWSSDVEEMLSFIRARRDKLRADEPETIAFPELSFDAVNLDTAWLTEGGLAATPRIGWRWCYLVYLEDPNDKWSGRLWFTPDWRQADPDRLHVRLASLNHREVWQPRAPLVGECRVKGDLNGEHEVPHPRCSCGIYTLSHREELVARNHAVPDGSTTVLVECALWGDVQTGVRGDRAQKAYPRRIYIPALKGEWEASVDQESSDVSVDNHQIVTRVRKRVTAHMDMTRESKLRRHIRENVNVDAYKPLVDALQQTYGVPVELAPMEYTETMACTGAHLRVEEHLPWLRHDPERPQVTAPYYKDYEIAPRITMIQKQLAMLEAEAKKLDKVTALFDHPIWAVVWLIWSCLMIWSTVTSGNWPVSILHVVVAAIWVYNLRNSLRRRRKRRKSG